MMWHAIEALELDEDVAYEEISYDGANDKDVDLFLLDDKQERVIIAQGKFNRRGRYSPKNGELLGVIPSSDWLSNREALEREGRSELVSAAADYAEGLARCYSVEYQYVFMGPATKEVVDQAELFNATELDGYPPKHATIVDSGVLESIHGDSIGRDTRIPKATVQLMADKYFKQDGATVEH